MGSFDSDTNRNMLASTKSGGGGEYLSEVQQADYENDMFAQSYVQDPRAQPKTKLDETLEIN